MTDTPAHLTRVPERGPGRFDLVAQVLDLVRLAGALFLRADFPSPWASEEAFSRALKRELGLAPAHRRAEREREAAARPGLLVG